MGADGLVAAWRRTSSYIAFAVLAVLVAHWWLTMVSLGTPDDWAFDFRQFWQGGNDVVNGVSPYPSAEELDAVRTDPDPVAIQEDFRFPYPAGAAVLLAPLGALGFETAAALWGLVLIGSIAGSLWILGVRDWRVFAVVASSQPVITSVRLGTFTPVLLLLAACAWRWRDRRWIAGAALAVALALKLFLWPLVVWLVATRRYAAAAIGATLALIFTLGAWAAIGFAGLREYPDLLRQLEEVVDEIGLSLVALGIQAGLPDQVAEVFPFAVGIPMLVGVVVIARRDEGDRRAYSLALVAAIAITPIVWLHYFTLLAAPLALRCPRFAWPWALMWAFWFVSGQRNEGHLAPILIAAALTVGIALRTVWRGRDVPATR
jgi:hypothetical protein